MFTDDIHRKKKILISREGKGTNFMAPFREQIFFFSIHVWITDVNTHMPLFQELRVCTRHTWVCVANKHTHRPQWAQTQCYLLNYLPFPFISFNRGRGWNKPFYLHPLFIMRVWQGGEEQKIKLEFLLTKQRSPPTVYLSTKKSSYLHNATCVCSQCHKKAKMIISSLLLIILLSKLISKVVRF